MNDATFCREDRATYFPEVLDPETAEVITPEHTDPPDGQFASSAGDLAIFQLSDPQQSVIAVLKQDPLVVNPRLVDEIEYDPCGNARQRPEPGTSPLTIVETTERPGGLPPGCRRDVLRVKSPRLEERHRIRGKGLARLHVSNNSICLSHVLRAARLRIRAKCMET